MANRIYMKSSAIQRGFRDVLTRLLRGDEVVVMHYNRPVATISPFKEDTVVFTIEIEVSTDGDIWQAVEPAETMTAGEAARLSIESADDAAEWTATHQNVAEDGLWRVRVWHGDHADIGSTPDAEYYNDPGEN